MPMSRRKFLRSGILTALGVFFLDALWIEKFFIEINEFYHGSATKDTSNIKVIQISDLHLRSLNYQLIQLTKKINELKPDLILITGDAIDKAENVPLLNDFLKLIDHNIRKIAILGNWEYWGKVDLLELYTMYADHNCTLLINQSIQLSLRDKTISITGLDDFVGGAADFESAIQDYKISTHHIILNHCPEYTETIVEKMNDKIKADFILSGHTHGGQLNFFGYIPYLPKGSGKYLKGWYDKNVTKLYVSKGIGTNILPARFGARAEIAIFNLTS